MHRFVRLLHDAHILQGGLILEVAALSALCSKTTRGEINGNVFGAYPEWYAPLSGRRLPL